MGYLKPALPEMDARCLASSSAGRLIVADDDALSSTGADEEARDGLDVGQGGPAPPAGGAGVDRRGAPQNRYSTRRRALTIWLL
jgi:hypothetical protein